MLWKGGSLSLSIGQLTGKRPTEPHPLHSGTATLVKFMTGTWDATTSNSRGSQISFRDRGFNAHERTEMNPEGGDSPRNLLYKLVNDRNPPKKLRLQMYNIIANCQEHRLEWLKSQLEKQLDVPGGTT